MQTLLTGMLLAPAPSVATAETRVIVSRNAEVMVVYLRAPLADVSGTPFVGLAPPDHPDTTMRAARDGALEAIDDMAARLTLMVDGVRVPLMAQSAVYHRAEDALAFETPLDASIASVICATPEARLPDASELTIYAAWTAPVPLSQGDVTLDWTTPDAMPVPAQVRVFERGRLRSERAAMIGPGLPLDLNLPPPRSTPAAPPMLSQVVLGGLGMILLLSAGAAWRRSRPVGPSGAPGTDPGP